MPITYEIDRTQRLVIATPHGVLTSADLFGYQHEVWSRPENSGYDELVDMTAVTEIKFAATYRISELASVSSSMDPPASTSKFAIVATNDEHFGLGRMYQAYRETAKQSTKEVRVFRNREDALKWLRDR